MKIAPMPAVPAFLKWLGQELTICIPISLATAWFISTLFREPFLITLVYSLCIGVCIQSLTRVGQYGMAYLMRRRNPGSNVRNWPGWGFMGPWVVLSATVGYFTGHGIGNLLTGIKRASGYGHDARTLLLIMPVVFAVSIGCVYFFYARGRMAVMEANAQASLRTAAESQLQMLQSQLEPHMLFNTLANLRVLIALDPPRAQAMLDHIISFLRATLEASQASSHPLSAEFDRITDYLEMMQVRMGSRLRFALDLPATLASLPVPPLLLQPLVENAIKHGLEPKIAGGLIAITARHDASKLTLVVRDTGVGLDAERKVVPGHGTSFGLRQVRDRLQTLFGAAGILDLCAAQDADGGTIATIVIPMTMPTASSSSLPPNTTLT